MNDNVPLKFFLIKDSSMKKVKSNSKKRKIIDCDMLNTDYFILENFYKPISRVIR